MYIAATDTKLLDSIIAAGEVKPQVKESAFIKYLLPVLLSPTTAETDKWLELVGSWYRGVEVIDDATNAVLFSVPPLIAQSKSILPQVNQTNGVPHQLETANRKRSMSPALASNMIQDIVSKSHQTIEDPEVAKQWAFIYTRYNIPMPESSGEAKKENTGKVFKDAIREEL